MKRSELINNLSNFLWKIKDDCSTYRETPDGNWIEHEDYDRLAREILEYLEFLKIVEQNDE